MITLTGIVREHPDAVFVRKTALTAFEDTEGFRQGGYDIAQDLFASLGGGSEDRTFILKPNVVCQTDADSRTVVTLGKDAGIVTSPHFVGGIADRLREIGASKVVIAEGGGGEMPEVYQSRGYTAMAEARGLRLLDLFRQRPQPEEQFNWTPVEGVVFREVPFVKPINDPDTVLVNVPTLKTHNLAVVSLCIKNLQGTVPLEYRGFCNQHFREQLQRLPRSPEVMRIYQPDLEERLASYRRHKPLADWQERDESYAQRACDLASAIKPAVHIVEGIVGRDGSGFQHGKDWITNLVLAGTNPVHVDTIAAYLMGHDPRNIPYLQLAAIRGMGSSDPHQIEVYLVRDGLLERCDDLEGIGRFALGVYRFGDTSKYVFL